jgi:hypothetical protein
MREDHSEDRNRRLEDRGKPGGNVKLRPEKQRVIYAEHQDAGPGEQFEIAAVRRNQAHPPEGNREQNDDRNQESNRDERNGPEIAQPEFDGEPGRAPDEAERDERSDRCQFGALFRHR